MNTRILWLLGCALIAAPLAAADRITASPQLPDALTWDLAKLSEPPTVQWLDADAPVKSMLFRGEPYADHATEVFAYYATPGTLSNDPSRDVNLPAVVLVHGGGGTAFREWVELWAGRGYAAIAMDLAGQRPIEGRNPHLGENREPLALGGPDQGDEEKFGNIAQPVGRQWPYHAVANVILAHSLIRSFPEVDSSRTAVTGISWGGYLTCIVAGIDTRFAAAVPVYGCGYLHENSAWLEQFSQMQPAQREQWVELWDPSQYLPAVQMPILFVNGTNDFAYPLDSYMDSYDAVPGPKQIRVTVNMPHDHPSGWAPIEIGVFIDHHLQAKPGLPRVEDPKVSEGRVQVAVQSPLPLDSAALHFTTDHGAINMRSWRNRSATIEGANVSTEAPPAQATAWFLTVTDRRGATVSTRVAIRD